MNSSTDSDSEISPRWSDTSTLGCVSSAAESGTSRRTLALTTYKSAGRHGCCSLFLDPYDGSSEDSEESNGASREKRQQGGCSASGQRRRSLRHHSASLTVGEMVTHRSSHQSIVHHGVNYSTKGVHAMDVEVQLDDSRLDGGCSPGLRPPVERSSWQISSCSSLRLLCKRKELPPEVEAEPRKRQRVKDMEDKPDDQ